MLTTRLITTSDELATLETPWNILAAGEPLRSWNWLATWWKHYGSDGDCELHVIGVYDETESGVGALVGLAPWYLERTLLHGSVLRPLGDGHVCTDHLSLLVQAGYVATVATALAEYLEDCDDAWDQLELSATDDGDESIGLLIAELESRGAMVAPHRAGNCWVIDLPNSWDEYVRSLSQSHRRQLRRTRQLQIDTGRCQWHHVTSIAELGAAWQVLVDLHQRRRTELGEAGCFASQRFRDFHRDVVEQLLDKKQLRMSWVELDGQPFTAEYHLQGPDTVYSYQSGMDTERLHDSPGRLSYLLSLQQAIEDGYKHFDFLRGDEPYKAHFRAHRLPQYDYRVYPNRRLARMRGQMLGAAKSIKGWLKQTAVAAKS